MKSAAIRQAFLDFFSQRAHTFVEASPIVLPNDPSLFFVNAGMNQFKDVFLGSGTRSYQRAVTVQPCIRISGKHNDLETVGHDGYHLTSFEMLGNWSFADYGKKEAIGWAWDLLTTVFRLPKDQLYATVYETDDESARLWAQTDIEPSHIVRCGKADNFWEMGETGPCGPSSELHIDRGPTACDKGGQSHHACAVNGDCARYIELWNLVFIQFNRTEDGTLVPLANQHVDTGAGLERLAAYLQGVLPVYDTDLFVPIINQIKTMTDSVDEVAFRVIADHIRTLVFAIADDVFPSNDGRGYVLRRLLRRAMRFSRQLAIHEPLLYRLVPTVIASLQDMYPHLIKKQAQIEAAIHAEESAFLKTLDSGMIVFQQTLDQVKAANQSVLSGAAVFKLYDTYGFPLDLTQLLAAEHAVTIDDNGFQAALEAQKQQSRQHAKQTETTALSEFGDQRIQTDTIIYCTTPEGGHGGEYGLPKTESDRLSLAQHHTATHVLQAALQQVLGPQVKQAGSLVDCHRLRFDFLHFQTVSDQQCHDIHAFMMAVIAQDIAVTAQYMSLDQARTIGAMALFGQRYPDQVRVIQIGSVSKELCGGHHVTHTGLLETIRIVSETGVAAGVRRMEVIVGNHGVAQYDQKIKETLIHDIGVKQSQYHAIANKPYTATMGDVNNRTVVELTQDYESICQALKQQEKHMRKHKQNAAAGHDIDQLKTHDMQHCQLVMDCVRDFDMNQLKALADKVVMKYPKGLAVVFSQYNQKSGVVVKLGGEITASVSATDIIDKITMVAGGSGGGRAQIAQAGGIDLLKMTTVVDHIKAYLCDTLG